MGTSPETDATVLVRGDIACNVLVIGAGSTGLRAAHKLAEAGTTVVVIDASDVGYGASGRAGRQVTRSCFLTIRTRCAKKWVIGILSA
ncbi:FAD-dependent oxidoreductase [Pseudahrensia aquimaris]|uniref:FAD-dependent oxidoreductase n=1 Tax=Pseudahrensia aquimaris TaxID=744461 RepID=A0ABW3FC54_9HYPH